MTRKSSDYISSARDCRNFSPEHLASHKLKKRLRGTEFPTHKKKKLINKMCLKSDWMSYAAELLGIFLFVGNRDEGEDEHLET